MNLKMKNIAIRVCAGILAVTSLTKIVSLAIGAPIHRVIHEVFGVPFQPLVIAALVLEIGLFFIWQKYGDQVFLKACCFSGALFLGYHGLMAAIGYHAPCPCMGGFLHISKVYGQLEQWISPVMAFTLFWLGMVGFSKKYFQQ